MFRLKPLTLALLTCVLLISACDSPGANQPGPTALPGAGSAEDTARVFLDAWVKNDYTAMYTALSPNSQAVITPDAFGEIYKQVEDKLKLVEGGKSYEILKDKTERQGTTVAIHYNMTFNSGPLGQFTDENRTMRLIAPRGAWRVAWSTMDIFEGMAGGATLELDLTQAKRGSIYDRNGKIIAQDGVANVSVRLIPGKYPTGQAADCFNKLAEIFRVRAADLTASYGKFTEKEYGNFGFTVGHLSKGDAETLKPELDAVCKLEYRPQTTRFYYGGGLAPQTIGYIGAIPAERLGDFPQYGKNALIGLAGVEQAWQDKLAGTSGARLSIRMPNGIQVRVIHAKEPGAPQDVTLTIDRDLQLATERAMASAFNAGNWAQFSTGAAAVVLDANTGEVLAIASYPTVDPDIFLTTTTFDAQDVLTAYTRKRALFNRATQELYALGSVFKIVSMAAAADTGVFKLDQIVTCKGQWDGSKMGDRVRNDWIYVDKYVEQNYHGPINLIQALTSSCDVYFWEVGQELNDADADYLKQYANRMGLGVKTGIDNVVVEATGNIPDPDWKFKTTGQRWGLGDNLNTVIGQGDVLVTPLQVARMMVGVANGGTLYHPYIVKSVGEPGQAPSYVAQPAAPDNMNIKPEVMKGVEQGLCAVTALNIMPGTKNQNLGTAHYIFYNWDFNKVAVCGKTGTAQTGFAQPNGWFSAYAGKPGEKPDLAIAVIVERSREGSETAAPIVRRIIESYYGLPIEPWPEFWSYPYEAMPDPGASDGGGPHIVPNR
ncbi:MAG: hypothetical protein IT324_31260 [Anaerolineae bacterium]|nr:hypothetical protein [Anaerolineae bacterium]